MSKINYSATQSLQQWEQTIRELFKETDPIEVVTNSHDVITILAPATLNDKINIVRACENIFTNGKDMKFKRKFNKLVKKLDEDNFIPDEEYFKSLQNLYVQIVITKSLQNLFKR